MCSSAASRSRTVGFEVVAVAVERSCVRRHLLGQRELRRPAPCPQQHGAGEGRPRPAIVVDEVPTLRCAVSAASDVAAGEVGLGGDEQALRQLEVPSVASGSTTAVRRLDGLVEQDWPAAACGRDRAAPSGRTVLRSGPREAGAGPLERVEGSGQVAHQRLDVGQVLVGDRRDQRLPESRRLLDRLLEVDAGLGQATDLGEQGAEVDVDTCLAELVGSIAEHFQRRFVGEPAASSYPAGRG